MKKHSKIISSDGNKRQNANNRRCPTCGTTTHKKGGLLGKKSVPITLEGKVYQGRCLSCDPFPVKHGPIVAVAHAVLEGPMQEELQPRRLSNGSARSNDEGNGRNTATLPPAAVATTIDSTRRTLTSSRRKSSISPQQNELHHDSEENSNHRKDSNRRNSLDSRLKEQQYYEQEQYNRHEEQRVLQTTRISEENNNDHARVVGDTVPLTSTSQGRAARTKATGVPKTLEVIQHGPPRRGSGYSRDGNSSSNFGDDHSAVSALTMDYHLFQSYGGGDEYLYYETNDDDILPSTSYHRRPGPERIGGRNYNTRNHINNTNALNLYERRHSMGGDVDHNRRRRRSSFNNTSVGSSNNSGRGRQSQNRYQHLSRAPPTGNGMGSDNRFRVYSSFPTAAVVAAHRSSNMDEEIVFERTENQQTQAQTFLASSTTNTHQKNRNSRNRDISNQNPTFSGDRNTSQDPGTQNIVQNNDNFPSFIIDDDDYNSDFDHNQNILQRQQQDRRLESNDHRIGMNEATQATHSPGSNHNDVLPEDRDINDMPGVLQCLNLEECNPDIRGRALCRLVDILQNTGQSYCGGDRERHAREFMLENDVIEAITKSMWADMEIVEVQEAAMNALLFIAASKDIAYIGDDGMGKQTNDNSNSNILSKNECVCDSILFTMQNHADVHGIQLKGTLIFASLAASSCDENHVGTNADGSLSGAMTMVLNAMSNHGDSRTIRQAGLQALHHQCLLSTYAEDNKRTFVESKLGNGMPAIDLIIYAMEELQKDIVAMEWACQLCWCLTANEDSLKQIAQSSLHEATMTICQHYMTNPVGVGLVEASVGTIANLASIERKRNEMINTGAIELVLDSLRYHMDDFAIVNEATLALENFAQPPHLKDLSAMFLKSEALSLLLKGLKKFIDYSEYVVQGIRTLTGFARQCERAKESISSPEIVSILQESGRKHKNPELLERCSILVATLASGETADISNYLIENGVVDLLLHAMEFSNDKTVQDATCLALRNLVCTIQTSDQILMGGNTLKLIVAAMDSHRSSLSIQTNGCCIFLNALLKANEEEFIFNPKIVISIIKAMQSHIESGDLLELACGALWVFVDRFDDQKIHVGNQAIDVVTCAMVMHPNTTKTLEKACGLLSNLSSEESLAKTIAKAQGVSIVSESMCNNANSISLLKSGCLTIKNILVVCPGYAEDGAVAISTVMMAMKENIESTSFVKEACDMLWVLASENETIRCKVLALDGMSTLMKCLEQHSNHSEVETSALGAFNQLAKRINQTMT